MARSGIIASGNWIVDHIKVVDRYPEEETLAIISHESRSNGGAPFNLLVDLALLGASFPLAGIGLIGDDPAGMLVRDICRENGIDDSSIVTLPDESTSYTDVVTVETTGKRTFFHHHAANARLDVDHFDLSSSTARHFHLGYLLLLDRLDDSDGEFGTRAGRVLADAKAAGMTTSIDCVSSLSDRFPEVVLSTLPHVDVCFMNELELSRTLGTEIPPDATEAILQEATAQLFDAGLRQLAVIHSARQGFVASGSRHQLLPAFRVPPELIRGTVGAGDAFAAGFLLGWHDGLHPSTCLVYAMAASATSLLEADASSGILPIQEALALRPMGGRRLTTST